MHESRDVLNDLAKCGLISKIARETPWPTGSTVLFDFDAVSKLLAAALPTAEVRSIARVDCGVAAAAYTAVRDALGPERLLWHGTAWESVPNIVRHGFNRAYAYGGRHGSRLGRGSYFAEDPAYALRFCGRGARTKAMFLSGVLPGRFARGEEGLVEPPALPSGAGARYDSTVDNPLEPHVFCVFRDFQALPLYIVEVAV